MGLALMQAAQSQGSPTCEVLAVSALAPACWAAPPQQPSPLSHLHACLDQLAIEVLQAGVSRLPDRVLPHGERGGEE